MLRCVIMDHTLEKLRESVGETARPFYGHDRSHTEGLLQIQATQSEPGIQPIGWFGKGELPAEMRGLGLSLDNGSPRTWYVGDDGSVEPVQLTVYNTRTDLFSRIQGVVNSTSLQNMGVAMFGLGSVGSSFANLLVKSGVGAIHGFDKDILEPQNIPRHDLDLRDLGRHKVLAIRDRLLAVNPFLRFHGRALDVRQLTPAELEGFVGDCHLVVDATGVPEVTSALALACKVKQIPMMAVGIYPLEEGGGGEFIYQLPADNKNEATPCYFCVAGFRSNLAFSSANQLLDYSMVQDAEHAAELAAVPGLGADIAYVTTVAFLHALGILDPEDQRASLISRQHNYRLIGSGVARGDFFVKPFQHLKVRPQERCPDCCGRQWGTPEGGIEFLIVPEEQGELLLEGGLNGSL